jgi:hypothetical protein
LSIEAEINKYNITARLIKHVLDIDIKRNFGSSDFDRLFGFKTTDDLAEGDTNKYFSSDLETDPIFSTWESSTDYLVSGDNVSELENDAGYLTEHQSLTDYAKLNDGSQMITSEQHRLVGDIDIVYDGDFVDTVTIGTRVVTFTNDGTSYTKWEDADYEWTPTYTDEKLTKIEVTEK